MALACLVLAGAADMVSGIFRDTLWNQTIPDALRGRIAGVELLSYGVGPSVGQIRAGRGGQRHQRQVLAGLRRPGCVGAVGVVCLALPAFTGYDSRRAVTPGVSPASRGADPAAPPR